MTYWNISFDETMVPPQIISTIYRNQGGLVRQLEESVLQKLDMAASLLQKEYICSGCVLPLMAYIMTLVTNCRQPSEDLSQLQKSILYMETHFRDDPTLTQVAEQACLSPVYYSRLFKEYTGMNYIQYLNIRKVPCAKMLLESGLSVTEACFSAGFGSLSGFLHTFKSITGMSPKLYRQTYLNPSAGTDSMNYQVL